MAFAPGDEVHVAALGKGIVRDVRNGGRYLVEIKGRSLLVSEAQLSFVDPRKVAKDPPAPSAELPTRSGPAASSIDLHGMTTLEAVAALDAFLDAAILAGLTEVRVIHGRSGGRVRGAVHTRLEQIAVVRGFRVDPANAGVTIVVL